MSNTSGHFQKKIVIDQAGLKNDKQLREEVLEAKNGKKAFKKQASFDKIIDEYLFENQDPEMGPTVNVIKAEAPYDSNSSG